MAVQFVRFISAREELVGKSMLSYLRTETRKRPRQGHDRLRVSYISRATGGASAGARIGIGSKENDYTNPLELRLRCSSECFNDGH